MNFNNVVSILISVASCNALGVRMPFENSRIGASVARDDVLSEFPGFHAIPVVPIVESTLHFFLR